MTFSLVHCLSSAATAAEPASQAVRFTVFAAKPISGLAYVPRPKAEPQKLQFYPTARSPQYEYHGAMPLRFVDATTAEVVAEAIIPPGMRDALLLLTPSDAAGAKLRYQVSVLDDGAARHGPGGLAIINFSGLALTGTINNEKVTVSAGLNPTLKVGRSARIAFSTVSKGRSYQSYAGTVTLERNERALLILFPPFYQGSLEVQSRLLVDHPPGTAPPKPPAPTPPADRGRVESYPIRQTTSREAAKLAKGDRQRVEPQNLTTETKCTDGQFLITVEYLG